ncbi:hypothetical protein C2W62_42235 [Candidatus Entotheonella serta]|nr:hypothetical protein C2W62_42235 [Candidatus Entotheonella serta]
MLNSVGRGIHTGYRGGTTMSLAFTVSAIIPASPQDVYNAWLDSDGHTQMTGSPAHTSAELGASFDAWDGYISGKNLMLEPGKRIVQSWRTTNFTDADEDSQIEVSLEAVEG